MFTTRDPARESFLTDDRGAVMVMGIFMCSCLVGALWYLAGIGDAILYRERMQEAADAVAFSDAALHARGMNLLVLVNLIMAVILGVRVALRTAKIITLIAATVFAVAGIFAPVLLAAAAPAAAAAEALESAGNAVDPAIDVALQALNTVEDVIAKTTPTAANLAATASVGAKYAPLVVKSAAVELGEPDSDRNLPVERHGPDVLCGQAGQALPKLGAWMLSEVGLPGGEPLEWVGKLMKELAKADQDYFCGLQSSSNGGGGGGGKGPSTDHLLDDAAEDRCKDLAGLARELDQFTDAEKRWLDRCAALHVSCESTDPASGEPLPNGKQSGHPVDPKPPTLQRELDHLLLVRDQDARSVRELRLHLGEFILNKNKCVAWARADLELRDKEHKQEIALQRAQAAANPAPQAQAGQGGNGGSSGDVASMAVRKSWVNGGRDAQIISGVLGNPSGLRQSGRLVRIATVPKKAPQGVDPEAAKAPAWAQAELFYDCGGTWTACNDDDDAMWHFRWRARLRRFNQPTDATLQQVTDKLGTSPLKVSPEAFADRLAQDALGNPSFTPNANLRRDLAAALADQHVRTQGVH